MMHARLATVSLKTTELVNLIQKMLRFILIGARVITSSIKLQYESIFKKSLMCGHPFATVEDALVFFASSKCTRTVVPFLVNGGSIHYLKAPMVAREHEYHY